MNDFLMQSGKRFNSEKLINFNNMTYIKTVTSSLFPPGISLQMFMQQVDRVYKVYLRQINLSEVYFQSDDESCQCVSFDSCLCDIVV